MQGDCCDGQSEWWWPPGDVHGTGLWWPCHRHLQGTWLARECTVATHWVCSVCLCLAWGLSTLLGFFLALHRFCAWLCPSCGFTRLNQAFPLHSGKTLWSHWLRILHVECKVGQRQTEAFKPWATAKAHSITWCTCSAWIFFTIKGASFERMKVQLTLIIKERGTRHGKNMSIFKNAPRESTGLQSRPRELWREKVSWKVVHS